jgi:hypothetical protein
MFGIDLKRASKFCYISTLPLAARARCTYRNLLELVSCRPSALNRRTITIVPLTELDDGRGAKLSSWIHRQDTVLQRVELGLDKHQI